MKMSYEKAREYALVKFAVPDYLIQGKPIAFLAEEAYRKGLEWAVLQARDRFLRSLRHKGQGILGVFSYSNFWNPISLFVSEIDA
jgi:hypothetical protein